MLVLLKKIPTDNITVKITKQFFYFIKAPFPIYLIILSDYFIVNKKQIIQ